MSGAVRVAAMTAEHADQVLAIYQHGIDEGNATFETQAPTWAAFDAAKLPDHRLVALDTDNRALGWAASPPSPTGARTRAWSSTPSTSTPRRAGGESEPRSSTH